jgi:hypothetical protein
MARQTFFSSLFQVPLSRSTQPAVFYKEGGGSSFPPFSFLRPEPRHSLCPLSVHSLCPLSMLLIKSHDQPQLFNRSPHVHTRFCCSMPRCRSRAEVCRTGHAVTALRAGLRIRKLSVRAVRSGAVWTVGSLKPRGMCASNTATFHAVLLLVMRETKRDPSRTTLGADCVHQ